MDEWMEKVVGEVGWVGFIISRVKKIRGEKTSPNNFILCPGYEKGVGNCPWMFCWEILWNKTFAVQRIALGQTPPVFLELLKQASTSFVGGGQEKRKKISATETEKDFYNGISLSICVPSYFQCKRGRVTCLH